MHGKLHVPRELWFPAGKVPARGAVFFLACARSCQQEPLWGGGPRSVARWQFQKLEIDSGMAFGCPGVKRILGSPFSQWGLMKENLPVDHGRMLVSVCVCVGWGGATWIFNLRHQEI